MSSKIEWLGGRYSVPFAGAEIILWLELPRGVIVASTLSAPREPHSHAESLASAMENPAEGSPRRPSRIRVADQRTARELRDAAAGIPIIVAPVPELDAAFEELAEALAGSESEPSYLAEGEIPPQLVEEMFEAASLLFRTAPWRRMSDQQILRVDIPRLGIDGACLSVIGAAGESFGLMLFSSIGDYHAFGPAMRAKPDSRPMLRSLSFDRKEDLLPSLVGEVEQHRWPVAGANAYPVVLCMSADLNPLPVIDTDVRIMTAVTRAFLAFFIRHHELFEVDDPEPVRESSEGEDGVKVTLTAPYVVFDEPPAAATETVHQMDFRLVREIARFASRRFGPGWMRIDPEDEEKDSLELILPWTAWTAEIGGRRVADAYLDENGSRLAAVERAWFAAQQESWLSVWEVISVEPGRVDVRDLLTGETRSVREELGSQSLSVRDTLLARVIDYRSLSYFGGMHSRALPPTAAAAVIDAVRARVRLRKAAVPAARLRGPKIGWFLIDHWTHAVERRSAPPIVTNTDGDLLQIVTDSFHFDEGMRTEIQKRIEAMEGFDSASMDAGDRVHEFVRASDDTMIGQVIVGTGTLRVETNSVNRADALAGRVRQACAGILRDEERAIEEPPALAAGSLSGTRPEEPSPEEQTLLRKYKENHYRKWLDMPLPALGGKTPRAAARSAKSRRELDLLLRDIENRESRLPEAARFDVAGLRRELRLEP